MGCRDIKPRFPFGRFKMEEKVKIFNDDFLNIVKNIADESIDLIVTDPPYPS